MKYTFPMIKSLEEISRGCGAGHCCNGGTEPEEPVKFIEN